LNNTVLANRPDIVLCDEKEKTCLLIDIARADDSNINANNTKKLSKYKDLDIEVSSI